MSGAAGFLGSWTAETLCNSGAEVVGLDNFSTGSRENLERLMRLPNFKMLDGDVTSIEISDEFDSIFHLASRPSPDDYTKNQVETLLVNSVGTQRMLDLARECDATLMFASTSEIYGNSEIIPTPETYFGSVNPVGEMSSYKESKRFGESLCMAYFRVYGLKVRIARIFNSYGPRIDPTSDYDRVVARFIKQALANRPITVHGMGNQSRSFCYVSDTVRGLIVDTADGVPVNIGSDIETSILQLAEMVKRLTGSTSEIVFAERRLDDTFRRCPDISRARKLLDWKPMVSLEKGLEATIDWFKAR